MTTPLVRFSHSALWARQRCYFEERGLDAWRSGEVPHYVTSAPRAAAAWAEMVFAYIRDCVADGLCAGGPGAPPIVLIELGAGCGRFAYHFLQTYDFEAAREFDLPPLRYVITDYVDANLSELARHPQFESDINAGRLDFALLDLEDIHSSTGTLKPLDEIALRISGDRLRGGPMICIAGYVFDSLAADLYAVQTGALQDVLVTADDSDDWSRSRFIKSNTTIEDAELLARYQSPEMIAVLNQYRADPEREGAQFLFPVTALQNVRRLREFADGNLLMLCSDKAHLKAEDAARFAPPSVDRHGSVSLMVNLHAINSYVREAGGLVLEPPHRANSVYYCAYIFADNDSDSKIARRFRESRHAFAERLVRLSPDDFFAIKRVLDQVQDRMNLQQMIAHIRLSGYDARILSVFADALLSEINDAGNFETLYVELARTLREVHRNFFYIGEREDLLFLLGMIAAAIRAYPDAVTYFADSLRLAGPDPDTYYNLAVCYFELRQWAATEAALRQSLSLEVDGPDEHQAARELLARVQAEVAYS